MRKRLLYRLFGFGAIPRKLRPVLQQEGIVVADEGMAGSFVARNVKGPGKRYLRRIEGFSGCLVLTKKRLVGFSYWKRQINIAVDDPKFRDLHVDLTRDETLSLSFESSVFREGWQGVMEFRFRTDKAGRFFEALTALGAKQGMATSA